MELDLIHWDSTYHHDIQMGSVFLFFLPRGNNASKGGLSESVMGPRGAGSD